MNSYAHEMPARDLRAVSAAYEYAVRNQLDLSQYSVRVASAEGGAVVVEFIDNNSPQGMRGSRKGVPQPTLTIDPLSGEILKRVLAR